MKPARINCSDLGVLLIDVQPSFIHYAFPEQGALYESLLIRLEHLLMLVDWLDIPLIATFEKPVSENGELPVRLEEVFPESGQRFEKNFYGCTSQDDIRDAIEELSVKQFAVAGAETDVCILQSVLGLLQMGYQVFLLEDCLFTAESQPAPALRRMFQAGAIPCTLKSMAYELAACVENTPWYPEGWVLKDHTKTKRFPVDFTPPEEWPIWKPRL